MREGSLDNILSLMMKRRDRMIGDLAKQFKGEKPFATVPFTPAQKIWAIDNLGTQDMDELRQEFGDEAVAYSLKKINDLRGKRWQTGQI
jgi:cytochrome c556